MKTSDKLLLTFFLLSLGVFGAVHLALYAEYRHGHILNARDLHEEQFVKYRMAAPQYLSLKGTLWVNIIPSDSFYVESQKEEKHPEEGFFVRGKGATALKRTQLIRTEGDTLLITGENEATIHRPFADYPFQLSVPVVNVYCRGLREIRVDHGQVILKGSEGGGGARGGGSGAAAGGLVTGRIVAENSTVSVGEYYNPPRPIEPEERFDSLDIVSRNSVVLLNMHSVIRSLHVRLDDSSELNDQNASVGRPEIDYSPDSRVNLTGANLKKVKIIPCN